MTGTEPSCVTPAANRAPLNAVDMSLYGVALVFWAFSWVAMHYQVGPVAPDVSIMWRFVIAAPIMLLLARLRGERLAYPPADHLRFAALGLFLFCLNFVMFYRAAAYVASGLLSVVVSLAAIINVGFAAVVLGAPIDRRVAIGAAFGVAGVALMFLPEIAGRGIDGDTLAGLVMAFVGTLSFCTGNMISARLQLRRIPVVAASAWGMVYSAAIMAAFAVASGHPFIVDPNPVYLGALVYLGVFATVVAFGCYLTLLGRIGADRAAYITVMTPVLSLAVSTFAEGYRWTWLAAAGLLAVLAGNLLVLRSPRTRT